MNSFKYDYENKLGWRVWSKEHRPAPEEVQAALAFYVALDPEVRKVNVFIEGRKKDRWVYENGQWSLFKP